MVQRRKFDQKEENFIASCFVIEMSAHRVRHLFRNFFNSFRLNSICSPASRFRYYSNEVERLFFWCGRHLFCCAARGERGTVASFFGCTDRPIRWLQSNKGEKSESDREAEQQAQCVDPNSFWYFTRVAAHAHLVTPYLARRRCISPAPNRTAGEEAPPQNTDIPRHAIDDLSMMKRRSYSAQRCHSQTRPSSR